MTPQKVRVFTRPEIEGAVAGADLIEAMAAGFAAYSNGRADIPLVGELLVPEHHGEAHIKYGRIKGEAIWVVKIASGFYSNPQRGLPSGNGVILAFSQETGEPLAVLLDEGYLTELRTAAAGALAARLLAPDEIGRIGIIGAGLQARMQARWLKSVTPCRNLMLWARQPDRAAVCAADLMKDEFDISVATEPNGVLAACDLVVTTTAAEHALLSAEALHAGVHITAMGSDGAHKQELDPFILKRADLVAADSRRQCAKQGETAHAIRAGLIALEDVVEMGQLVTGEVAGRQSANDITVADLTGVAVQDIAVVKAVLSVLAPESILTCSPEM